jgi:hypothetical protein
MTDEHPYRTLALVVREVRPDFGFEVRVHLDGWIELWDCSGKPSYCFKAYHTNQP